MAIDSTGRMAMSDLRQKIFRAIWPYPENTAPLHVPRDVDAVMRVLAEHGDAQPYDITEAVGAASRVLQEGEVSNGRIVRAVMAVVHVVRRDFDAEIQRLRAYIDQLQVYAEHGDMQQVRHQISAAVGDVTDRGEWRTGEVIDAAMAVIDGHLAAADAASGFIIDALLDSRDTAVERTNRAEADLAAARQQLDQVRRTYDAWTEEGLGTFPGIENTNWPDAWRDLGADLDGPAQPAGRDESGQLMDVVQRAAQVLAKASHATRHIKFDETGNRAWFAETMPQELAQALADAGLLADITCRSCSGTGGTDVGEARCAVCDGSGHRRAEQ